MSALLDEAIEQLRELPEDDRTPLRTPFLRTSRAMSANIDWNRATLMKSEKFGAIWHLA